MFGRKIRSSKKRWDAFIIKNFNCQIITFIKNLKLIKCNFILISVVNETKYLSMPLDTFDHKK